MKERDWIDVGTGTLRKFYYEYFNKKKVDKVTPKTFLNILEDYHDLVVSNIVLKNKIFYMPYSIGQLYLGKRKPKVEFDSNFNIIKTNAGINHKATNELWARNPEAKSKRQRVYYQNEHTDNHIYFIRWSRSGCNIPGVSIYRFLAVRSVKRTLAKKIKEGEVTC